MTPGFARDNIHKCWLCYTKHSGEGWSAELTASLDVEGLDFSNLLFGQDWFYPAFFDGVPGIIMRGAKKEMVRTNAVSDITLMQNHQFIRNWTKVYNPGSSVRAHYSARHLEAPIPVPDYGPRPQPARFSFINKIEESTLDARFSSIHCE